MSEGDEYVSPGERVSDLLTSITVACVSLDGLKGNVPKALLREAVENANKHLRPPAAKVIAIAPKGDIDKREAEPI